MVAPEKFKRRPTMLQLEMPDIFVGFSFTILLGCDFILGRDCTAKLIDRRAIGLCFSDELRDESAFQRKSFQRYFLQSSVWSKLRIWLFCVPVVTARSLIWGGGVGAVLGDRNRAVCKNLRISL